jgi:hypothetical protein
MYMEHDLGKAVNMKMILCFYQLSHLKHNFHKSKIFLYGKKKEEEK